MADGEDGQPFVVENTPGAGNNIGVEPSSTRAARRLHDAAVNPANGINATLYKNLSFNFIRDIAPVAGLVRTPNVMEVTNSLPVKTVQEFIAYCKANPGKINMASSGSGTSVHLSGELFKVDDRLRHGPCAVQGRRPGIDRPDRRSGARAVRQPAVVDRPHQGRQAATSWA
jgi:tripartite-type tricarboxylate transporter receptor subunit TctC